MITVYRGVPIYGVPLVDLNGEHLIEIERYVKIFYNYNINLIIQEDKALMMIKMLAFRNTEDEPFFSCYLKNVFVCSEEEGTTAWRILADSIGEKAYIPQRPKSLNPPAPKPPLGKLRKVPTCECCGGEIDFETLTCKYCKTKYYIEEDTNEEDIHITTDERYGGIGYTSNPSRYNQRRREDLGRRLHSGFIPDWS